MDFTKEFFNGIMEELFGKTGSVDQTVENYKVDGVLADTVNLTGACGVKIDFPSDCLETTANKFSLCCSLPQKSDSLDLDKFVNLN